MTETGKFPESHGLANPGICSNGQQEAISQTRQKVRLTLELSSGLHTFLAHIYMHNDLKAQQLEKANQFHPEEHSSLLVCETCGSHVLPLDLPALGGQKTPKTESRIAKDQSLISYKPILHSYQVVLC